MNQPPKRAAYDALDKSIRITSDRITAAKPSAFFAKGRKMLAKLEAPHGSLADSVARRAAGRLMIDELSAHHKRTKKKGYRHFLVTICWDAGVLGAEPSFDYDLDAMQIKAYKALNGLGLSGICVFEAVALRKSKLNPERLIIHLHGVLWTSDQSFQPIVAAKKLMARGSFPNSFGAPSVSIQSRKMAAARFRDKQSARYTHLFAKLHKDQTKASISWLGYYLFQAPAWVKQLVPRKDRCDGLAMRSNSKNYSPQLVLALNRLLSEIQFTDSVFSVGDGKSILGPWRTKFRKEFAVRDAPKLKGKRKKGMKRKSNSKAEVRRRRARLLKRLGLPNGSLRF